MTEQFLHYILYCGAVGARHPIKQNRSTNGSISMDPWSFGPRVIRTRGGYRGGPRSTVPPPPESTEIMREVL